MLLKRAKLASVFNLLTKLSYRFQVAKILFARQRISQSNRTITNSGGKINPNYVNLE
jgi:hypothetical protein